MCILKMQQADGSAMGKVTQCAKQALLQNNRAKKADSFRVGFLHDLFQKNLNPLPCQGIG